MFYVSVMVNNVYMNSKRLGRNYRADSNIKRFTVFFLAVIAHRTACTDEQQTIDS